MSKQDVTLKPVDMLAGNTISKELTKSEDLTERLIESIVSGEYPAGSKISEPELARSFGVSRGPLREAMMRVESLGLVERVPHVGARVVELSQHKLIEIYAVREALEGMAARLAARHMDPQALKSLRELLASHHHQMAQPEGDDGRAYFQKEGDLDFHYRIVKGSGNQRLYRLLCNDLYHLVRLYRYQFGMPSKRGPRAFVEHGHIVDAIERHDAEMAELMMRAHIRASRENVERLLAQHA